MHQTMICWERNPPSPSGCGTRPARVILFGVVPPPGLTGLLRRTWDRAADPILCAPKKPCSPLAGPRCPPPAYSSGNRRRPWTTAPESARRLSTPPAPATSTAQDRRAPRNGLPQAAPSAAPRATSAMIPQPLNHSDPGLRAYVPFLDFYSSRFRQAVTGRSPRNEQSRRLAGVRWPTSFGRQHATRPAEILCLSPSPGLGTGIGRPGGFAEFSATDPAHR